MMTIGTSPRWIFIFCSILIAFNKPSLEKFAPLVKKGGIIIYDSLAGHYQPPEGVGTISIPATQIAREFGVQQAANTAMFGALMEAGNLDLPRKRMAMPSRLLLGQKAQTDTAQSGHIRGGSKSSKD